MGIQSIDALERIVAYPEDVVGIALAESRSVASDVANLEQRLLRQMKLGKNGFQIVGGSHGDAP